MQITTITTLVALAAAALQPPPPPPPPRFGPANVFLPASPAVNAWMDANIKPGPDWRPVIRSAKGMTLVRWGDARGSTFDVDIRSERAPPSAGQKAADDAQSWTTTYRLECHTTVSGAVGYVSTGLHFKAEAAAGFSGQNMTGEAHPMALGVTLENPQALFSALCHDHEQGAWKEQPGPSDLTNAAAVEAWDQATLDQKGWVSAPSTRGFMFVSDRLTAKAGLRTGQARLEYLEPRYLGLGSKGVLIRSVQATVEFDCAAMTARATGEKFFGRRNLKGGVDDAMPVFVSTPDFPPAILWQAFGAHVCA
jgi:hypothetical protein